MNHARQRQPRRPGMGLARFAAVPLAAQIFCAGCSHWVVIRPDFAQRETRKLDKVRVGGNTIVRNVSIEGPIVTASQSEGRPVIIDLRENSPSGLVLTPEDAAAIAKGQSRKLDQVRLGNGVLNKATLSWPYLTGSLTMQMTYDLRTGIIERETVDPGPTSTIIVLSVLGGIGLVSLGIFGLAQAFSHIKND